MSNEPTVGTTTASTRTARQPRSPGKSVPENEMQKNNEAQNMRHKDSPPPEEIRHAAYLRWIAAGSPECDGVEFWLAAESDLAQAATTSKSNFS